MKLSPPKAFVIVLALWAGLYLPVLGTTELAGHEGVRVVTTVEMFDNGEWLLPHAGGLEYYNKPPGINWLIAASFYVTGQRSEWSARLPSALLMLAFVSMLVWMRSAWLTLQARLVAAAIFLTCIGVIGVGRSAEIEAPYMAMTGMAILWWLNVWSRKGSRWSMWLVPAIFLAFGGMLKGPILGVMFYCAIVCVLAYHRSLRELLTVQHLAGIATILAVCMGWVYLAFYQSASGQQMLTTWAAQWLLRVDPDGEHTTNWLLNIPRSFGKFGIWAVFLPLLWVKRLTSSIPREHWSLFRALRLAAAICFVMILLLPFNLPRYTLPAFPLACVVLGWVLSAHATPIRSDKWWKICVLVTMAILGGSGVVFAVMCNAPGGWLVAVGSIIVALMTFRLAGKLQGGTNLAMATAAATAVACLQFIIFTTPLQVADEIWRPKAKIINSLVPEGQPIYGYKFGRQTITFYINRPMKHLLSSDELDGKVRYLMIRPKVLAGSQVQAVLAPRNPKTLYRYKYRKNTSEYLLIELEPVGQN